MLLKDFYTINKLESDNGKAFAQITINKNHDVFKGHFPGNPVTPAYRRNPFQKTLYGSSKQREIYGDY